MIDFWTRQHMSLSFWIRDYLFSPLYKSFAQRWPQQAASLAFVCYFVAMFLAGVWHGASFNFVIFGLLHGAGVSTVKLWEMFLTRTIGCAGVKEYLQQPVVRRGRYGAYVEFRLRDVSVLYPRSGAQAARGESRVLRTDGQHAPLISSMDEIPSSRWQQFGRKHPRLSLLLTLVLAVLAAVALILAGEQQTVLYQGF